jgi:hypothetical protein
VYFISDTSGFILSIFAIVAGPTQTRVRSCKIVCVTDGGSGRYPKSCNSRYRILFPWIEK